MFFIIYFVHEKQHFIITYIITIIAVTFCIWVPIARQGHAIPEPGYHGMGSGATAAQHSRMARPHGEGGTDPCLGSMGMAWSWIDPSGLAYPTYMQGTTQPSGRDHSSACTEAGWGVRPLEWRHNGSSQPIMGLKAKAKPLGGRRWHVARHE